PHSSCLQQENPLHPSAWLCQLRTRRANIGERNWGRSVVLFVSWHFAWCGAAGLCWLAFACQILTLEKVFFFCYGIGGKTWKEAMTDAYKFSNSENQSAVGAQGKK